MKQGKHYTTVILWILLIAIAAYFGYSVVTSIHQPLTTATVMEYEAGSGYYAAGFVVRDETVIESEYGITVLTAKEGARVASSCAEAPTRARPPSSPRKSLRPRTSWNPSAARLSRTPARSPRRRPATSPARWTAMSPCSRRSGWTA